MNVNFYERLWMWGAGAIVVAFLGAIVAVTVSQGRIPPSNVETIDPTTIWSNPKFAERGVKIKPDGSAEVTLLAFTFAFVPNEIRVPAGKPVTFRLTSADVTHGLQIVGTNANTMVIPGYVSQFTITFDEPGEYLIVCNEYCGNGHHLMSAKLIVEGGQ